jgi:arginyl-tRNA synthetase
MITEILSQTASDAILQQYGEKIDPASITIQETLEHFEGDYTLVLFPLLKISRKSPQETGEDIASFLVARHPEITQYQIVKGFLNLSLADHFWNSFMDKRWHDNNFGLKDCDPLQAPVMVEFSSPNTNKPLHLGHIRNNLIGYSVSALMEAAGKRVVRVNLVNDRGIHICKSMIGWMKFGRGKTPAMTGVKGDKFVGDFYVAFDRAYKEEVAEAIRGGATQEDAEKNSVLLSEARSLLRLWEEGEEQTRSLWRQMNEWVYAGFDATYGRMGISFDKIYYESETYLKGKEMVLAGLEKGLLQQKGDGSVWIDMTADGMDEKVLLRSDGTSVYITQDIGTALIREEEYHPEKMLYVVGNEQNYHFDVLKKVLARLNYDFAGKIQHLSYGMVELPSGRMKSREGTVVDADDLMDEMQMTARRVTVELGKWNEEEIKELDDLFEMLGAGALKYYILKVDPKKNMLFNPEESIDFNGNTGPFIQYTHARIASLLRKASEMGLDTSASFDPAAYQLAREEKDVLKALYRWPQLLEEAASEMNPAAVASYCYELARGFNQFYHGHSVLSAGEESVTLFRVRLSAFTANVLKTAMGLLGISLPEKM